MSEKRTRAANAAPAHPQAAEPQRRAFLQGAGAFAAAAAATQLAQPALAADQPQAADFPAMRRPQPRLGRAASGKPALPALAVIVLNRMGFGPRAGDIDAFNGLGATDEERIQAYVAQQLNPAAIDDSACDAILAAQGFQTLDKSLAQLWADHVNGEMGGDWKYRRLPAWETERAAFLRALHSRRQLAEILADFWHNHFNVFGWDWWIMPTFVHYDRDVIRGNMLGNFRKMLGDVARSPAMLYYLDNQSNSGGNPNENYARELFELHGMGAENYFGVRSASDPEIFDENGQRKGYVDSDVYGATTCFTGWRANRETGLFEFNSGDHFPFQKIVLSEIIPEFLGEKDGDIVLDLIANHPGTARFIARKLCRRFISDHPPEALVQQVADVFFANREADDQLTKTVEAVLLSPEFRTAWGDKVKRPFEYAVSVMRATDLNFDPLADNFFWYYEPMGQELFGWHPPDGYPDFKEAWTGTMPMLQRWRLINSLLSWEIGGEGADKDDPRLVVEGKMPADATTPEEIVDWWSQYLLGYLLPAQERQQVVEFMAYGRGTDADLPAEQIDERLRWMVGLLLMAPSFQWR